MVLPFVYAKYEGHLYEKTQKITFHPPLDATTSSNLTLNTSIMFVEVDKWQS